MRFQFKNLNQFKKPLYQVKKKTVQLEKTCVKSKKENNEPALVLNPVPKFFFSAHVFTSLFIQIQPRSLLGR